MSRILLAGEVPLAHEFAAACCQHGHTVAAMLDRASGPVPEGVRTVARPAGQFDIALELTLQGSRSKSGVLAMMDQALPPGVPILTNSLAVTVSAQAAWVGHPERLIGIGAYAGVLEGGLLEFAVAGQAAPLLPEAARSFSRSLGKEAALVPDLPGMVLPRIRCMLANEACFALAERIATPAGIDTAMKLGTGYPAGPIEWAERVGLRQVVEILEALQRMFGEERYRPSPLLRQAALLGSLAAAMTVLPASGGTGRKPPPERRPEHQPAAVPARPGPARTGAAASPGRKSPKTPPRNGRPARRAGAGRKRTNRRG